MRGISVPFAAGAAAELVHDARSASLPAVPIHVSAAASAPLPSSIPSTTGSAARVLPVSAKAPSVPSAPVRTYVHPNVPDHHPPLEADQLVGQDGE